MNTPLQRLQSQQLLAPACTGIADSVSRMGALQAQDFAMSRWAIGVRHPGTTDRDILRVYDEGGIIRTHLLRPTWHIVAAADLRWMLALTAPHVRASMASRHRELEITPALVTKSHRLLERAIGARGPLTRDEVGEVLERGGIVLGESRLPHLLMLAEIDAVICSGPMKGARPTYALVDVRVPAGGMLSRDAALAALAVRYFSARGPATLRDFVWWTGLPVRDARRAVASLPPAFSSWEVEGETVWCSGAEVGTPKTPIILLLPAYDEFLIAYTDRSASLPASIAKGVVSSNGIFRAVVLVNGRVAGLWSRTIARSGVKIVVEACDGVRAPARRSLDGACEAYADFIGKDLLR